MAEMGPRQVEAGWPTIRVERHLADEVGGGKNGACRHRKLLSVVHSAGVSLSPLGDHGYLSASSRSLLVWVLATHRCGAAIISTFIPTATSPTIPACWRRLAMIVFLNKSWPPEYHGKTRIVEIVKRRTADATVRTLVQTKPSSSR